ncbi:hypothetical protein ACVWWJ_002701 [Luteibacter sp. HA06]
MNAASQRQYFERMGYTVASGYSLWDEDDRGGNEKVFLSHDFEQEGISLGPDEFESRMDLWRWWKRNHQLRKQALWAANRFARDVLAGNPHANVLVDWNNGPKHGAIPEPGRAYFIEVQAQAERSCRKLEPSWLKEALRFEQYNWPSWYSLDLIEASLSTTQERRLQSLIPSSLMAAIPTARL